MSSVSYRHFTGTAAENYQRDFVPLIATPVSKDLLRMADLQPGEHVLDVACGTGHVTRAAAERVGDTGTVTGIDIAPDMIEVAKSVPVPAGASVEWQISDAAALPIPDASADVALCQMGLMFMEDRPAAVAEMRRVLEPSGRLVINTPGRIPPFFEALERATRRADQRRSRRLRQRGLLACTTPMTSPVCFAGPDCVTCPRSVLTTTLRLPAPAEFLWQYIGLTPMAAFIEQAPRAAKSALERQFVDEAQEHVVDGVTVVDLPMVVATARP